VPTVEQADLAILPLVLGALGGLAALGGGLLLASRQVARAREAAARTLAEAERDGENRRREITVAAQERALALQDENERREGELEERESGLEQRMRQLDRQGGEQGRERKQLERRADELKRREAAVGESEERSGALEEQARQTLERIAGLTATEARSELVASIEEDARREAARIYRRIEDESRQNAEREARNLIVQASQRVNLREVMESTVTFIELPNDEMKGRIIGKEGRNIRALELATGIDLIVDDTPRSIWISSFDPIRREIARVSIDRLLEDGRIHPARIEEVVQQVTVEIDALIEEKGNEAAFALGISDLRGKLAQLVGRMRYHTTHGQNLLQHTMETALLAGFMCQELEARPEIVHRAGLLHEIGQVVENNSNHTILTSAELCAKYRESEEVVETIRALHPDVAASTVESLLLNTANRLSESRPGARKENLAVFIERLRRLESIATGFPGVQRAYAVKAGKELRVIVDTKGTRDENAYKLAKEIARALERELSYPGHIKVSVVRETRAVRFAV
jgi:ribonuclease Y